MHSPCHPSSLLSIWTAGVRVGGALLRVYAVPSEFVGADEVDPVVAEADSRSPIDECAIASREIMKTRL